MDYCHSMYRTLITLVCLASLLGCDPGSTFVYKVENCSTHTMMLRHPLFSDAVRQVEPGETLTKTAGELGSHKDHKNRYETGSYCPCGWPDTEIRPLDTTLRVIKDVQDCGSWEHHDEKRKFSRGGSFECTFVLSDADVTSN